MAEVAIIRIELPSEEEKKTPVAESSAQPAASSSGAGGGGGGAITAKDVIGAGKKVMAYTGIKQIADSVISYQISTVELKTGATEYQQKLQFAYSEGAQALSSVATIGMGFAMGGPVGGAVAAVGVGISYVMKFIGWAQNAARLETEQNLESISIGFASTRAGVSGRRSNNQ